MILKYSLNENQLTDRTDDYSAMTHASGSFDMEAIINRMLSRGTLVTRTDVVAVMNNFQEAVVDIINEGGMINTPLFNTSFSISGVFESPLDSFDPNRHKLNINLTKGVMLRNTEKAVKFEKTHSATPLPQIQEVRDSKTGSVNEVLTSNGVVEVYGYNLKIAGDDPRCGLWFIATDGVEIRAEVMIDNKPSKIIAMIPQLDYDEMQIKIVTQYTGGVLLKNPRTYVYPKTFFIVR